MRLFWVLHGFIGTPLSKQDSPLTAIGKHKMEIPDAVYGLLGIIVATIVISISLIIWARYKDKQK